MRKELGKTMSAATNKEYFEGNWGGKDVKVNRVFRGHRFTNQECKDLLAGKEIEVLDLVSSKTGKTYGVKGKLTNQTYNGHAFVGFEQTGFASKAGVPDAWCGHTFIEDEKILLEQGKSIEIDDAVSKKTGRTFSCKLSYGEREDGTQGIIPDFSR